jgi:hypothetical protein
LENKRAEQFLLGSRGGGGQVASQCIHMSVNVKMIKIKKN